MKSYKIRLYPTKEQKALMWKHIDGCRFIYNYMLNLQSENYKNGGKYISHFGMNNLLKPLKNDGEHEWLYEISNKSLQITCGDLHEAFQNFFAKRSGYPKFKSRKKSKTTFPICIERLYFKDSHLVNIEKIGKVKYKTDFTFSYGRNAQKFYNARVTYDCGKWLLTFAAECENQAPQLSDKSMGIDVGIKDLAIAEFDGQRFVFGNINKSKRMRTLNRELKHLQRSISRKYEANKQGNKYVKTKNIEKAESELKLKYKRIRDIRTNYIHQVTHYLVSLLPARVVMEDLNIKGMMKNKHLSKAIAEQCLNQFLNTMKYKCEWNGIEFVQADRFYPSSKTCSCCGYVKTDLKLSDRTFVCPNCGTEIDRDYNAAINLSRYAA